jgi:hypothetical protein
MSSIVEISAATPSVVCDAENTAKHVVNVHNISGHKLRVGARIVADDGTNAQWLGPIVVPGKEELHEWVLDAEQTIQLTVPISAKDAAPGKYTFRVEIYSSDAPSEDFTTGDGIAFEVTKQEPEPAPTPKPFPWMLVIVAVVVGLLLLGGGGWLIYNAMSYTQVPDLSDLSLDEAKKEIAANKLVVGNVTSRHEGDKPKNTVIDQHPPADSKIKKGRVVNLVTESGTPVPITPRVHKEGRFTLEPNKVADLDDGRLGSAGDADIKLKMINITSFILVNMNGAKIMNMGDRTITYADCKGVNYRTNSGIPLRTMTARTSLCVKTSKGRFSALRVQKIAGPPKLGISFTTWEKRLTVIPGLHAPVLHGIGN